MGSTFKSFLFILIVIALPLQGKENLFRLDGLAEPSTYINDCVNAVSGAYIQSFPDIVVEGPEPISFTRHYCSNNLRQRDFGIGFSHNHPTQIMDIWGKDSLFLTLEETGGNCLEFTAVKKKGFAWFYVHPDQLKNGMTNACGREISGRSNPKNTKIHIKKRNKKRLWNGYSTLHLGDGRERHYPSSVHMSHEICPSTPSFKYRQINLFY